MMTRLFVSDAGEVREFGLSPEPPEWGQDKVDEVRLPCFFMNRTPEAKVGDPVYTETVRFQRVRDEAVEKALRLLLAEREALRDDLFAVLQIAFKILYQLPHHAVASDELKPLDEFSERLRKQEWYRERERR